MMTVMRDIIRVFLLVILTVYCILSASLQCFDTVGWAAGRASGL